MNINFAPFVVVWIALAVTVLVLIFRHKIIASQEDAHMDLLETAAVAQHHMALDRKLENIDKWGRILTAIAVIYGLLLAALYMHQSWQQMFRAGL